MFNQVILFLALDNFSSLLLPWSNFLETYCLFHIQNECFNIWYVVFVLFSVMYGFLNDLQIIFTEPGVYRK